MQISMSQVFVRMQLIFSDHIHVSFIFILKTESINNNKLQLSSSLQKNVATFFPRNNLLHDVVEINN